MISGEIHTPKKKHWNHDFDNVFHKLVFKFYDPKIILKKFNIKKKKLHI